MRRALSIALVLAVALAGWCAPAPAPDSRTYSVTVLGDLHFDADPPETYHSALMAKHTPKDMPNHFREFKRNAHMWREGGLSRRMVAASAACVTPDTAFAIQLGDIIQGDCESDDIHKKMLTDMARFLKGEYPSHLPLAIVAGNHDIRSGRTWRAAEKSFADFSSEWHGKELRALRSDDTPTGTDFVFRQGPDIFFVFDFNDTLASTNAKAQRVHFKRQMELLKANKAERYTFVFSHGPVLPFASARVNRWFLLGSPALDDERRALRAELASRNAIALSGHTHRLEFKDAEFPEGRITEYTLSSVMASGDKDMPPGPNVKAVSPENYNVKDKSLREEYAPYMRRYRYAVGAGHAKLRISDEEVCLDYYDRDSTNVTETINLR